jgi:hypothetical protein
VGRGRAVYLNLSPQRYLAYRQERGTAGADDSARRPFLAPLVAAGITPWISVRANRQAALETIAWEKAGRTYVFVLQKVLTSRKPPAAWGPGDAVLPLDVELAGSVKGARDERTGKRLADGKKFQFDLDPATAVFWSFAGPPPLRPASFLQLK